MKLSKGWLIALFLLIFALGANLGGGADLGNREALEGKKQEKTGGQEVEDRVEGAETERTQKASEGEGETDENEQQVEQEQALQNQAQGEEGKREKEVPFTSPVIAHALGGFDYYSYLNSPVGFEQAYQLGCRLFEVDLTKTSDGVWVCRHGWTDPMGQWEGENKRLSLSEFLASPLYGKYETLSYEGLFSLMEAYPDAYLILDTKNYSLSSFSYVRRDYQELIELALLAGKEALLDRFIPEIYNEAMYYGVEAMHDFPAYVYSFWEKTGAQDLQEAALFCAEQGITAVCLGYELQGIEDMLPFTERGIPVYFFTVNDEDIAQELMQAGATGVVSDFLAEKLS